ncbi:MAG TPA: FAD-dependent oxidoreductase [Terriglobales bacterium]|nr:FAD-dependent oxidoreductase [Terriglobales bacterium]
MKSDSGQTLSVWMATAELPQSEPLRENTSADVCIVGAGIAGLTTAYLLVRAGRSVVVLEDGEIAGGETCRTTAHLSNALDDRYYELERLHGAVGARIAAASHAAAIDQIEAIVRAENIECSFSRVDGYLFVGSGDTPGTLDKELDAATRAGVMGVKRLARAPLDSFDTGPVLHFPMQGQFHVLQYLAGVAEAIRRAGGKIYCGTHVDRIKGGEAPEVGTSDGHTVRAKALVVATNSPVNDMVEMHTKQAAYRTYVVAAMIPRGTVPAMLLWDTEDPYHYVRLQSASDDDHDLLIVGGEDHKTGQADDAADRYQRLENWTRQRFPQVESFAYRWSGQVLEPVDGLAFLGPNPLDKNVYIATGDSGHGMTHGTIAGILLTDLITGKENPWAAVYDPSRKSLKAFTELARENLNVALQYTDHLTGGDVGSVEEIRAGSGAIVRRGLKKIAAYRDEHGVLHERSAICTHLGCVVQWNSGEKSWDCPCHGSRFATDGHVVNGPATAPLAKVEDS